MQVFDTFRLVVWHDDKEIIARTADSHVENILLVKKHLGTSRNRGWWVENGDNYVALIALEAVNRSDLNIYSTGLGRP